MTCSLLRSRTAVTVVVQDWPVSRTDPPIQAGLQPRTNSHTTPSP